MAIVVSSCSHEECTINGSWRAALGSIKAEIPATTADGTVENPDITSIVDMEGSVRVFFHKITVLIKKKKKKIQERKKENI